MGHSRRELQEHARKQLEREEGWVEGCMNGAQCRCSRAGAYKQGQGPCGGASGCCFLTDSFSCESPPCATWLRSMNAQAHGQRAHCVHLRCAQHPPSTQGTERLQHSLRAAPCMRQRPEGKGSKALPQLHQTTPGTGARGACTHNVRTKRPCRHTPSPEHVAALNARSPSLTRIHTDSSPKVTQHLLLACTVSAHLRAHSAPAAGLHSQCTPVGWPPHPC